ncbi:MAG: T9SS type A sorting domain-containing protein [Bacteroidota bacterium]
MFIESVLFNYSADEFRSFALYDVLGQEVATLVNEVKQPGTYTAQWDASGVTSGVHSYRLQAGSFVDVKKLMVLK